jgi:poly(A) polymerase
MFERRATQASDADVKANLTDVSAVVVPTQNIHPAQIDGDAMKVVNRLRQFGYSAYLVGGCVRDLMLHRKPKDFDVATSAKPPEIRKLFRNCRLIGRRFRLAHIHFRDNKVIETATFRAGGNDNNNQHDDLLIREDNVFGTEEQDAIRRDFTINALFYDPLEHILIDYIGGLEDLVNRNIRFIGRPDIRVREDPVRIIRAIKFAALLNFKIDDLAWEAMRHYRKDLSKSAPARLLEEICRVLRGGAAETGFRLLWQVGALEVLLPEVSDYLGRALERAEERDPGAGLFAYLRALDLPGREAHSNAVMLASLLFHPVMDRARCEREIQGQNGSSYALAEVSQVTMRALVNRLRLPKWEAERIQQIIGAQKKLFNLPGRTSLPRSLVTRHYFPEALDLFAVGVQATGKGSRTLKRLRQAISSFSGTQPLKVPRRRRSRKRRRAVVADMGSPSNESEMPTLSLSDSTSR